MSRRPSLDVCDEYFANKWRGLLPRAVPNSNLQSNLSQAIPPEKLQRKTIPPRDATGTLIPGNTV